MISTLLFENSSATLRQVRRSQTMHWKLDNQRQTPLNISLYWSKTAVVKHRARLVAIVLHHLSSCSAFVMPTDMFGMTPNSSRLSIPINCEYTWTNVQQSDQWLIITAEWFLYLHWPQYAANWFNYQQWKTIELVIKSYVSKADIVVAVNLSWGRWPSNVATSN